MIYIHSNDERTMPEHFDAACVMYGAIESVRNYRLTTYNEIAMGKFDMFLKRNLCVGSTEFMRMVFSRLNITNVGLPENSNRPHRDMTLGEMYDEFKITSKNMFIKPKQNKLFTGLVYDGAGYTCLNELPLSTELFVYQPFTSKIRSEWRLYVHHHKITDSHIYDGDFHYSPNYDFIQNIVNHNKEKGFPVAYTVDVGILESLENVVVEYNDMWAIGNYGIPNWVYINMLSDRYFEIVDK